MKTFLLDMDGVIVNFVDGIIRAHNLTIRHDEWTDWNHHRTLGISDSGLWEPTLVDGFWENLTPYAWSETLVRSLAELGDIVICSTPYAKDPTCMLQKVKWVTNFFNRLELPVPDCVFSSRKYLLAKPDVLLLDDRNENVRDFIAAGGQGALFPQPWNDSAWFVSMARKIIDSPDFISIAVDATEVSAFTVGSN